MRKFNIFLGIFFVLAISRLVPHPPNFTSLIALSFYVPALLGMAYMPIVVLSLAITDIFLGFHNTMFFTWSSVILISFIAKYFSNSILKRFSGAFLSAVIFYLVTNFGVWATGLYENSLSGLITSYIMAIPFFGYTVISTIVFFFFFEASYKLFETLKFRTKV